MFKVFLVFLGGGLGSASRYGVSLLAARLIGTGFPWGTLAVNLVGCFLIGLVMALAERGRLPAEVRLMIVTGFLGGLTTFSSYSLETMAALRTGEYWVGWGNVLFNNFGGLALTLSGMHLGGWK